MPWTVAALLDVLQHADPDGIVAIDDKPFDGIIEMHPCQNCKGTVLSLTEDVVGHGLAREVPNEALMGCPANGGGMHDTLGPAKNFTNAQGKITHGGATCSNCGQFPFQRLFEKPATPTA